MKYGPGRHLQSSSRCQRNSTRCTGEPHSWQGGEARAIRSALFMASECRSQSRAAVQCASLRTSRCSTRRERPAGTGRSRSLRTARTAPSSAERPLRGREGIGRRLREIDSLGLIAVCVSEVHSRCPRSSPTLSYRHGARLGVIDRAPIPVSAGTPGAGRDRRGARLTTRSYESVVEADIEALAQRRVPYARQGGARSRARRSRSRARASGRRCARGHRSRDRRAVGRRLGSRAAARRS
jgi:hypothetical protein